jgi:hypothetical protein
MIILRNKQYSFLDYFKKDIGPKTSNTGPFRMFIEAEYDDSKRHKIKEHTYIQGTIDSGIINVGDEVDIVGPKIKIKATVEEIWTSSRKKATQAKRGDKVDLQLNILNKNIDRGMIAYTPDSIDFALAERMSKKYTREHFPPRKKTFLDSLFESTRKARIEKQRKEDQLKREKWEKDIETRQKQIKSIEVDEPLTYKELYDKYPKLKELNYIVRNEKKIIELIESIAPLDIKNVVGSFIIFTGTQQTPEEYKNNPEYCLKLLRNDLKSSEWIPCFDGFDISLIYNKKFNKFYYLDDLSISHPSPQPITVSQYCKKAIQKLSEDVKEEVEMEWDEYEAEGLDYREVLNRKNNQIQKLKQLLQV